MFSKVTSNKLEQSKFINIGIIGAGFWACHVHIPRLFAIRNINVIAINRRSITKLKKIKSYFAIDNIYTDTDKMFNEQKLDGVIVCSPNYLHAKHAQQALSRSIPVFVEKPLTLCTSEARKIISMAENNSLLFIGYQRRFSPIVLTARKFLFENRGKINIDKIKIIWQEPLKWAYMGQSRPEKEELFDWEERSEVNFRSERKLSGGIMWETGSHVVDMLVFLLGERKNTNIESFLVRSFSEYGIDILFNYNKIQISLKINVAANQSRHYISMLTNQNSSLTIKDNEVYFNNDKLTLNSFSSSPRISTTEAFIQELKKGTQGILPSDSFEVVNLTEQICNLCYEHYING